MSGRQVAEEAAPAAQETSSPPRPEVAASNSASFVLAMQRSAGNAAVVRHLARRAAPACGPPRTRPPATARVQRLCEACTQASRHDPEPEVAVGRVLARWPGDGMAPP